MHVLKNKHIKLSQKESEEILKKYNISKSQLPKILLGDPGLPEGCNVGDIIKIERKDEETGEVNFYYRVVV
ncbi:MAG: DNA-directed RNA polymerase subunit H [Candidatus Pacearchaeota archaeon]|nr:MAG: DNA-directed RNA polymerase subunit H [Candidatus Pacearchaeota archaeon]